MPVDDLGDYDVDPVEGNPFGSMASSPNDYHVAPVDHDPFASAPDPAATPPDSGPSFDPETGLQSFDPANYTPREPQTPVYGGQWGKAAELGYEDVRSGLGSAIDWLGNKFESGVGVGAATLGMPAPAGFARDMRGILESGEGLVGLPRGETPTPRSLTPSGFYSHGAEVASKLQPKGTVQQMVSALNKGGVKPEEMARAGISEENLSLPLFSNQPIARDELVDRFNRSQPQLQETQYGEPPRASDEDVLREAQRLSNNQTPEQWGMVRPTIQQRYLSAARRNLASDTWSEPPKYDDYTIPGGENYRELLLHAPEAEEVPARDGYAVFHSKSDGEGNPESPVFATEDEARQHLQDRFPPSLAYEVRSAPFTQDKNPNYESSHWDDVPNVIAHLRMKDRTGPSGENLLHLEELQSDWGQAARGGKDVPEGPFVGSTQGWTDLGLKRALIEAARGGYDGMIWTPGADQAARYSLTKHVSDVSYSPHSGNLQARAIGGGRAIDERGITPEKLPDYVGQETAKKLLEQPQGMHFSANDLSGPDYAPQWALDGWHTLSGLDLETGGEGMKGYYDRMLPNRLSKLTSKLDPSAKIGQIGVPTPVSEGGYRSFMHQDGGWGIRDAFFNELSRHPTLGAANAEVQRLNRQGSQKVFPHLPMTPAMRAAILKGLPQYARGGAVAKNEGLRNHIELISRPRHGFADGGDPEPVDHDPFAAGQSALDKMTSDYRATQPPDQPQPEPEPPPPVYGGKYGQAAEDAYQTGMGYVGRGMDWLGNKLESGVGTTAAALGVPAAPQLARDVRAAIMESGELGPREEPRPNVARYNHPAFPEGRIATRIPTAVGPVGDAAHLSNDAKIGLDTMQGQPKTFAKTAAVIQQMPFEPGAKKNSWVPTNQFSFPADATHEDIHNGLVDHFTSNILALHDAVDPEIQPGSQKWYEGANARAIQKAQLYGKPLENIAGAYAAMSPKMDWFQNVSLSERLMDIVHNQGETAFTPEMNNWVAKRYGNATTTADLAAKGRFDGIAGKTLNQLDDPLDKAHWVRAYDEAHNPRDYNIVNPDGTFSGPAINVDGSQGKAAWGNGYKPIAKAITAFTAPDMPTISRAMGEAHKVRSFYNNIIAPWSDHGDVTVDTHAIAAALLRPLSGDAKDVTNGLGQGGPDNAAVGSHGLYGAYVEAYRKAAAARNILPRQMQSITWEALRGLWNPEEKASEAINSHVRNVWAQFRNGEIDQAAAQRKLLFHPETGESLIKPPDWHTAGWRP